MLKKGLVFILCVSLAAASLCGCGKGSEKGSGGVTLKWYARINKQSSNDAVFKKASEMTQKKLGVKLNIIPLEDYNTKISVINASGEDYDIAYSSSTVNNFYQNIANGNFLELDELLPKYASKLYESMSSTMWDGIRVNGKIYGVMNQQIFARGPAMFIPAANIEKLGIDTEEYANYSLADYENYLRLIKEKTGSYTYLPHVWTGGGYQMFGLELVLGSNLPGAIYYNEENPTIINQYETEEYKNYIKLREKWVKEGLTAPMETSENDITQFAGKTDEIIPWLGFMPTYKPGVEQEQKQVYNVDIAVTTKTQPLLTSYGLVATMAVINSETKNPEKSVEFLEYLNTDKEFYNLLVYGIEGVNYEKTGKDRIKVLDKVPYSQPSWAIGNVFNSYFMGEQQEDIWDKTREINESAKKSPILGFAADVEDIKLELTNCSAVQDEYLNMLDEGLADVDTTYKAFITKLKAAGVDKLIEKLNVQLENWRKNQ